MPELPKKTIFSIQEAANFLGVSTKTLRRWEQQSLLSPARTSGNQRRYTLDQLQNFHRPQLTSTAPLTSPFTPEPSFLANQVPHLNLASVLNHAQWVLITAVLVILVTFGIGFAVVKSPAISSSARHIAAVLGFPLPIQPHAVNNLTNILGSTTSLEDLLFNVNVPANFGQGLTIEGDFTAPNVIYRITAGTGITVTGGQNPIISATDTSSDLKIFKTVKVGSTEISAGSKADTLTLAAGDNITLSTDTDNKKITIKASSTDVTTSGWTDDGTLLRLTTAGDLVSIGSATGAAKLAIDSDTNRDVFTASQSGNLLAKLTNTGLFNLAATGFSAGLKLQNNSTFFSGSGVPSDSNGANGDYYFRSDAVAGSSLYVKVSGAWATSGSNWQRNSGTLAPLNTSDDLLLGSIATSSAVFRVSGLTGAVNAGGLTGVAYNTFALSTDAKEEAGISAANDVYIGGDLEVDGTIYGGVSGTITPGFTDGSVVFTNSAGALAQDNSNFFWNDTTNVLQIAGSLITNATTFNLVNGTATTVNFAGAATTLEIGAATGTTDVNNTLNVTGDLDIDGGDLTASTTSFNLLQSTVTTLNIGGAATISLGASTGTTTINNANTVVSGDLAVNGGDLTTTATTFNFVTGATTLNIGATTGTTTIANDLTIGNAITDAITFTGRVAADNDLIPIGTTGTNDLGSSVLPWDNIYVSGVTAAGDISFAPTGTFDITFTTDSDSTAIFTGLSTSTGSGLCLDASNNLIICSSGSGSSLWTLSGSTVYANLASYDILTGSTTTSDAIGKFTVSGAKTGKALVVLNETGNQDFLAASASGVPIFNIERDGDIVFEGATNNDFETTLAVSDPSADRVVTIPNASGTICLDTNNCTGGTAGPWDETSGLILLDTITNNVVIGGTSNLAKLAIDGDTDEIQFLIQAHSTQTTNFLTLENSSGTDLSWFDESANLRIGTSAPDTGRLNITGAYTGKALAILDETGDQAILTASASGVTVMTLGRTGNLTLVDSGSSNIDFNLSSTGDFTISDAGTAYATFTDAGVFTLDSLNLDGTTIGLTSDTDLLSLAANALTVNGSVTATTDIAINGGDLTSTATTFNLLNDTVLTLNLGGVATTISLGASSGTTTINNALAITGALTANGDTTLGNAITDNITFTGRVALDSDLIPIGTTGTNDLGSSALPWDNLYANNIVVPTTATGQVGYWTRAAGVLSPAILNDVIAATTSATVALTLTQTGAFNALLVQDEASDTTPFVIDQSGNVGIGTTAPDAKLHVTGAVTGKALTIFNETGDQNIFTASQSGIPVFNLARVAGTAANGVTFTPAATTGTPTLAVTGSDTNIAFSIDGKGSGALNLNNTATGDILIGGGSASTGCTITNSTGALACSGAVTTTATTGTQGWWTRSAGVLSPTNLNDVLAATTSATVALTLTQTGAFNALLVEDSASDTTPFVIDQSGNVGIGTTSPGALLGIQTAATNTTIVNGLAIRNNGTGTNTGTSIQLGYGLQGASGSTVGISGYYDGTGPALGIDVGGSLTRAMTITNAGNVGIGDTTPDAKLEVLATTEQLRLTYTDDTVDSRFTVDSAGDLTINNTGTQTIIADDLAVNGGDITTTATTATLFNTNATTLSLGGAATTLNLGTTNSVTRTINLGTGTGADTINIGTGGTAADTINLGSSASTTALNLTSGTGSQTFTSSVVSGSTTTSAFAFLANSITTGTAQYLASSTLSTGKLFDAYSTSTALTTGSLGVFNWEPSAVATASGDLFRINIGAAGDTTGNLFNITDSGSSLFSVSTQAVTTSLPAAFNAAGDVSFAYDLNFTNQTSSWIKSNAPLYIEAGESFENNNLTLKTYGTGQIVTEGSFNGTNVTSRDDETATSTNTITGRGMVYYLHADTNTTDLDVTTTYNVTGVPNTYGTVVFINSVAEKGISVGSRTHTVAVQINGTQVSSVVTATGTAASTVKEGYTIVRSYDGWKIVGSTGTSDSADYAEVYKAADNVESAEVVALTPNDVLKVERGTSSTLNRVIGVTSTSPAYRIGEQFDSSTKTMPVALSGRVPVKVSSSSAPLQIGDSLTASSEPGKATKATQPGRTIGRALEPWTPGQATVLMFIENSWSDPADEILDTRSQILDIQTSMQSLESNIASISAQLANLQIQNDPGASLSADLWQLATDSGKLTTAFAVQVPELNVLGKLTIGLLTIDDLTSTISSLLGEITIDGDLAISGSIKVLGTSAGFATIPAGDFEVVIANSNYSTESAVFVTPKIQAVPVASQPSSISGEFKIKISEPLFDDLEVQWWVVN